MTRPVQLGQPVIPVPVPVVATTPRAVQPPTLADELGRKLRETRGVLALMSTLPVHSSGGVAVVLLSDVRSVLAGHVPDADLPGDPAGPEVPPLLAAGEPIPLPPWADYWAGLGRISTALAGPETGASCVNETDAPTEEPQ